MLQGKLIYFIFLKITDCFLIYRTEQQFHPEIYKSTKCNDIQNTSYCPRGAFCAFAHVERKFFLLCNPSCRSTIVEHVRLSMKRYALE
jgi:hypothetical protein